MTQVLLLGGPPGVGKSTLLKHLGAMDNGIASIDADDVWPAQQQNASQLREAAMAKVMASVKQQIALNKKMVILAWVFARPALYSPFVTTLTQQGYKVSQIYLIATTETITQRLRQRAISTERLQQEIDYALGKLQLIQQLAFAKIDVSDLTPQQSAVELLSHLAEET